MLDILFITLGWLVLAGLVALVLIWAYHDLPPLFRSLWHWLFSSPRSKWSSLDYPTFLRRVKEAQKKIEEDRKNVYK